MEHMDSRHSRHGGSRRPGAAREMLDAVGALTTTVADAVDSFMGSMGGITPPEGLVRRRRHTRRFDRHSCCDDEPCKGCSGSSCECDCCVGDADLVIYTRIGERRVVPVRIENTRAREREISVALSDLTTRGGGATPVEARLHGETDFTLKPCEEREIVVLVAVGGLDDDGRKADREGATDIDECHVAVGDLRITGCDLRPVRIAVAVLPRGCSPYEIECGCGCC